MVIPYDTYFRYFLELWVHQLISALFIDKHIKVVIFLCKFRAFFTESFLWYVSL